MKKQNNEHTPPGHYALWRINQEKNMDKKIFVKGKPRLDMKRLQVPGVFVPVTCQFCGDVRQVELIDRIDYPAAGSIHTIGIDCQKCGKGETEALIDVEVFAEVTLLRDGVQLPWIKFLLNADRFYGWIKSPADWQRLKEAYPKKSDDDLLDCKEATCEGRRSLERRDNNPNYGMRFEHDGERTLRDFFQDNGMTLGEGI